jgi:hypothetical protein
MEQKQYDELVAKLGKEATDAIDKKMKDAQKEIDQHLEEAKKGQITEDMLKTKMDGALGEVKEHLSKLEGIAKEQGTVINQIKEQGGKQEKKTIEDVLKENLPAIKALYKQGMGNVEIDMKTAGVTSIGNSILPMNPAAPNSPYLPGTGGAQLDMFGLVYNPNFITNAISLGRTNLAYLPWANEVSVEGAAAAVQEGAPKPLWNTRFKVEFSTAKKIAAMTVITEEFDQDLPGFTTLVKRLLQEEVRRKWDDAVYADVIAAATGFTTTAFTGKVDGVTLWDAVLAGFGQIESNNFDPNFVAMNPLTYRLMQMSKDAGVVRAYSMPPFIGQVDPKVVKANKVAVNNVLVGDVSQYKVDLLGDFVLKVGWNMDDFNRNQFSVVAEVRYHDYISNNRKAALAYYNLNTVMSTIDSRS